LQEAWKIEEVRSEIEEVNSGTTRERPQREFLLLQSHFYLLQSISPPQSDLSPLT